MWEKDETRSINSGWTTIFIIWIAMFVSLAVWVFFGHVVGEYIGSSLEENAFLGTLRSIFYGVSIVTILLTKNVRNFLLKSEKRIFQTANQINQHPVVEKYITAVVASLALSESIGMYGLVLFFLGKSTMDLYFLITLSAIAMLYYRPRKEELFDMAQKLRMREAIG